MAFKPRFTRVFANSSFYRDSTIFIFDITCFLSEMSSATTLKLLSMKTDLSWSGTQTPPLTPKPYI